MSDPMNRPTGCCHHRWMRNMLWTVRWPTSGISEDYLINFLTTIKYHLERGDVYLICDRCIGNSTNEMRQLC